MSKEINIKQEIEIDDDSIYNKCPPIQKEVADYENPEITSAVKIKEEIVDIKQENDENDENEHLVETGAYYPVSIETEPNHIIGQQTTLLTDKKQTQQRAYAPRVAGYRCVTCGDNFKWKKSLEEHTKKHETDDRQVATTSQSWIVPIKQELDHCETGDGQLATPNLSSHIKTEPADHSAGDIHTDRASLAQHGAQIAVEIKLESEAVATRVTETICDSERPAMLPLEDIYTSKPGGYRCHTCYATFRQESLLTSHIKTHKEKQFSCSVCGFVSVSENGLRAHRNSVHRSPPVFKEGPYCEKPYKCSMCEFKTANPRSLRSHKVVHTGEKPYKCSVCDYKTTRQGNLAKHELVHTGEKPHHCSICDYKTSLRGSLIMHERTHTGEKPYQCSVCEFRTTRRGNLTKHERIHTGEKPHHCSMCGYKTSRRQSLILHVRMHTGEKPHKCSICEFKTGNPESFRNHQIVHTGEKPYECSVCDFRTTRRGNLKKHERIHTGEKPYHCSMCDYKTLQKGSLIMHIRTHTGEKPYECGVCEFRTASLGTFKKHKTAHTGDKPHKCTVCDFKTGYKSSLRKHIQTHATKK